MAGFAAGFLMGAKAPPPERVTTREFRQLQQRNAWAGSDYESSMKALDRMGWVAQALADGALSAWDR